MPRCPHGLDPTDCHVCIARAWRHFHNAVTSARERLPEGTLPAMLICINTKTGELDVVAPGWLEPTRAQTEFLRQVLRQIRSPRRRRTPLE
jgi:hypothetical protein